MILECLFKIKKEILELKNEDLSSCGAKSLLIIESEINNISSNFSDFITAKTMDGKDSYRISPLDAFLIKTDGRNIVFHIKNSDNLVVSNLSLKEVELKWSDFFERISRSELVSKKDVLAIKKKTPSIEGSSSYQVELRDNLGFYDLSRRGFYKIQKILNI